ncbi:MAG: hypothetical protein HY553_13850 [Elusimicrobia bacterium]|nr:hypothetical protein [Elusimicrobiota bacterium]
MVYALTVSVVLLSAGSGVAAAAVVEPDCSNYPEGEQDPVGRDRSVVLFHNACGTKLPSGCRIDSNPGLLDDAGGLRHCMEGLGSVAGHVLEWQIRHDCSGDRACEETHRDLCLGKANRLQLRRRLLRCSEKARTKLDNWSAELLGSKR